MIIQGLQIPFGVQPVNPVPVDAWSGPYDSVEQALLSIPIEIRFPTMEVRVLSDTGNEIYWFRNGIGDGDLILFAQTTITQSDTPPVNPKQNDKWINTISGVEYFWYGVWVSAYGGNLQYASNANIYCGNCRTHSLRVINGGVSLSDNNHGFTYIDGGTSISEYI